MRKIIIVLMIMLCGVCQAELRRSRRKTARISFVVAASGTADKLRREAD